MSDLDKVKDNDIIINAMRNGLNIDYDKCLRIINDTKLDLGDLAELSFKLKRNPPTKHKSILLNFFKSMKKLDTLQKLLNEEVEKKITPQEALKHKQNLEKIADSPLKRISIDDPSGTKTLEQDIVGVVDDKSDKKTKAIVKDPLTKKTELVDISQVKEIAK